MPQCVMNNEGLRGQTAHEVGKDEFENIVIGGKGGVKNSAFSFHKPQEAFKSVCFQGNFSAFVHCFNDGRVGKPVSHGAFELNNAPQVIQSRHFARSSAAAQDERDIIAGAVIVLADLIFDACAFFSVVFCRDNARVKSQLDMFCGSYDAIGIGTGMKGGGIKGAFRTV